MESEGTAHTNLGSFQHAPGGPKPSAKPGQTPYMESPTPHANELWILPCDTVDGRKPCHEKPFLLGIYKGIYHPRVSWVVRNGFRNHPQYHKANDSSITS